MSHLGEFCVDVVRAITEKEYWEYGSGGALLVLFAGV